MKNSYIIDFNHIGDSDIGYLVALEGNKNIPFNVKRVYYTYGVPKDITRGFHAHKNLEQVLVCINGSLKVKCFNGEKEKIYILDTPNKGLYIGSMIWHEMCEYDENTVLMVLASEYYDESDYIRNYEEFLQYYSKEVDVTKEDEYFIHEKAIVDTDNIGKYTKVWGFSHVFPKAKIGKNCNICEHVLIENDVIIGDNVTVKSGVYIWDGVRIEDNVFIGPSVTFINDRHPRSKQYPDKFSKTIVNEWASLGANSTIMCGVNIGEASTIGAGSVVLNDIKPFEVAVGNPAKVIGYNCICGKRLSFKGNNAMCTCNNRYKMKEDRVYKL